MAACALLVWPAACRSPENTAAPAPAAAPASSPAPAASGDPATESGRPKIVLLGDSLTAGLGLLEDQAYPALLQKKLDADGYKYDVENAGVSGDTSAGGLRRLDWALQGNVRVLVVALGANDGLRGLSTAEMKSNLTQIIQRARERDILVILAGHGSAAELRRRVRRRPSGRRSATSRSEERVAFIPFLLDRVAGRPELNQGDGIHPNAQGAQIDRRHRLDRPAARRWIRSPPHDRAARRLQARAERQRHAHHPASPRPRSSRPAVSWRSPGLRAAASRRCSGLLAGLDSPSEGRVVVDGVDITALDEDALARLRGQRIGFVFQFFHLLPSLTALENVLVPMEIAGAKDAGAARRRAARRSRARRPQAPLSLAAFRRRAAARRHRPCAGQRAAAAAGRRADGQPGQPDRPSGDRAAARA